MQKLSEVVKAGKYTPVDDMHSKLKINDQVYIDTITFIYKIMSIRLPQYLLNKLTTFEVIYNYNTCTNNNTYFMINFHRSQFVCRGCQNITNLVII